MIKNIFLDAGGVILDETVFEANMASIITKILQNYKAGYSLEDYRKDADEAVFRFVPKVYDYILFKNINDIDDCKKAKQIKNDEEKKNLNNDFRVMRGLEKFLSDFSGNFRIGILGQYGSALKDFLQKQNLLRYFTFTETQENYTITKPDPRYFEAILGNCSCIAEESIMIGDRIDKDIIPARMIGMKTIRIRTGLHKNQKPRTPDEIPDFTFDSLGEISLDVIKSLDMKP